jgi:Beta protein
MNSRRIYVPILKGKRGEYLALQRLTFPIKSALTPMIEILPPTGGRKASRGDVDGDETAAPRQPRTTSSLIRQHATNIKAFGRYLDWPIFIDVHSMPKPTEALKMIAASLPQHHIVPVCTPRSTKDYLKAAKGVAKNGLCYRISPEVLFGSKCISCLAAFLESTSLRASDIDLVIDLKEIEEDSDQLAKDIVASINSLPDLADWRSVVLAGGSFPIDLSKRVAGESVIPRYEWRLYRKVCTRPELKRVPLYGDYGIQHPSPSGVGFLGKANIRYTANSEWIIFRGAKVMDQSVKESNVSAQMKALCEKAITSKSFANLECWADEHITECAGQSTAENEASTWKAVGFNHHMTKVVVQLRAVV